MVILDHVNQPSGDARPAGGSGGQGLACKVGRKGPVKFTLEGGFGGGMYAEYLCRITLPNSRRSHLDRLSLAPSHTMSSSSSPVVVKRKRIPGDDDECHGRKKARGSFLSFEDARTYVRTLGLKSEKEWWAWSKSGKRQHDIPSDPYVTYKSSGWTS